MAATYQDVLTIALALTGVTEGRAYGTPSLHVGKKLMARLREDGETLVAKVDPAERSRFLESFPDVFFLEDHYREHPLVLIQLAAVSSDQLRRVLNGAWRMVASSRQLAARDKAAAPR